MDRVIDTVLARAEPSVHGGGLSAHPHPQPVPWHRWPDHHLEVTLGEWPEDLGTIFVVDPTSVVPAVAGSAPRPYCVAWTPDARGRIVVRQRLVRTRLSASRASAVAVSRRWRLPSIPPLGVTNLANTNVETIADRLFLGYDTGHRSRSTPTRWRCSSRSTTASGSRLCPASWNRWSRWPPHPRRPDEHTLYFVNCTRCRRWPSWSLAGGASTGPSNVGR